MTTLVETEQRKGVTAEAQQSGFGGERTRDRESELSRTRGSEGCGVRVDEVKEFLRSAIEARIDLRRHKKKVAELDAQCARLVANMNGMPRGGGDDHSHEQMWNQLSEAREQELLALKRAAEQERTVECFINCLPCALHRSLLKLRYVDDMTWVRIQFALYEEGVYYNERHIRRIHGDALQEARSLWKAGGPWERTMTDEQEETINGGT